MQADDVAPARETGCYALEMFQPPPLSPTIAAVPLPLREAIHAVAQQSFRHVQLSATQKEMRPRDFDQSARRDLRSLLRRLELSLTGLDFLIPPGHFVDLAHADRAADAAFAAIELAADLGRHPLTLDLPPQLTAADRDSRAAELLTTLINHADRFGVPLANLGDPSHDIEGLGLAIDLSEPGRTATAAGSADWRIFKRINSVRCSGVASSGARVPLGNDSQTSPLELQLALAGMSYAQPVVLDARGWADPLAGFERSAGAWGATAALLARRSITGHRP